MTNFKMFRLMKADFAGIKNEIALMRFIKEKAVEHGMNPDGEFEYKRADDFLEIIQTDGGRGNGRKNNNR